MFGTWFSATGIDELRIHVFLVQELTNVEAPLAQRRCASGNSSWHALDVKVFTATAMLFQAAYAPSRADDTDEKKAAEKKKACTGAVEYIKARFARLCRT